MTKVLLIGSGACASKARSWDLEEWTVGAINNAWSIPQRLDDHIRSGDWVPARGQEPPMSLYLEGGTRLVSWAQYDGERQRRRFGRQHFGIGATMLWNAAYWMLATYEPTTMGFVGCSMAYPRGESNTFYVGGSPDPLRFPESTLQRWYALFQEEAANRSCECVNFGEEGLCPYPRQVFPTY